MKERQHKTALDRHKLERRKVQQQSYDRVLIVTEGSKTEPYYFEEVRSHYELNFANVVVCGDSAPSPFKVVKYARMLLRDSRNEGNPYDKVFCVFDRDSHGKDDYDQAIQECRKSPFCAIYSVPCFEYWLLLHLKYTNSEFTNCAKVESAIKKAMPKYNKANQDIIESFVDNAKIAIAIENADKNRKDAKRTDRKNPMTNADELVGYLQKLHSEIR